MAAPFETWFHSARVESATKAEVKYQKKSRRYQQLSAKEDGLTEEIRELLGQNGALVDQLVETKNLMDCLSADWIYRQAFHDCFWLMRWMGAFPKP